MWCTPVAVNKGLYHIDKVLLAGETEKQESQENKSHLENMVH